jgi:hypothetical protein
MKHKKNKNSLNKKSEIIVHEAAPHEGSAAHIDSKLEERFKKRHHDGKKQHHLF